MSVYFKRDKTMFRNGNVNNSAKRLAAKHLFIWGTNITCIDSLYIGLVFKFVIEFVYVKCFHRDIYF